MPDLEINTLACDDLAFKAQVNYVAGEEAPEGTLCQP